MREVKTKPTDSTSAHLISRLDAEVDRLIAVVDEIEAARVAKDAEYDADFAAVKSLAARLKAVLDDPDAQDEMLGTSVIEVEK